MLHLTGIFTDTRRQIEAEHVKETQELQQCWMELRHVVRCVYREAGTGFADNKHLEELERLKPEEREARPSLSTLPDVNKMKELVHRQATNTCTFTCDEQLRL